MKSSFARGVVWTVGLLVCAGSMWVSYKLATLHYAPPAKESLVSLMCNAFEGSSCEKVARSRWSMIPPLPLEPSGSQPASGPAASSGKAEAEESDSQDLKPADPNSVRSTHQGIPTAEFGLVFFGAVLCWLLFTGPTPATRMPVYVLFLLVMLAGLAGSIGFEVIMWTQLDAWCPMCVAAHAGSLILFVVALLLWPRRAPMTLKLPEPAPAAPVGTGLFEGTPAVTQSPRVASAPAEFWPSSLAIVASLVAAVLFAAFAHYFLLFQSNRGRTEAALRQKEQYKVYYTKKFDDYDSHWEHNLLAWQLMPIVKIPVEDRPVRGAANAAHTMVVFSDFECPGCAQIDKYFRDTVMAIGEKDGRGGFKIIHKHWPICKTCNSIMDGKTLHPHACEAAYAAEAARIVGGDDAFWKMHDLLFDRQKEWKESLDFVPLAREIGLNEDAFRQAMASKEAFQRVQDDIADGKAIGDQVDEKIRADVVVTGTPTVFVDGKRLNSLIRGRTWAAIASGLRLAPARLPSSPTVSPGAGPRVGQ